MLLPCAAAAHEDRVFLIAADGTLRGTPDPWGVVSLDLRVDESKAITSVVLSAPHFKTRLDDCLIDLMKSSALTEVSASGSWYHDRSVLPPYVALEVRRKGEAKVSPHPTRYMS